MPEFIVETEFEIIRNLKDPKLFIEDSFEVIPFSMGISFIVGNLRLAPAPEQMINPDKKTVQAVKFEKPTWDLEDALDWLQENQKDFNSMAKKIFSNLKEIKGVEIFAAGTWNGDTYTIKDIDDLVEAFDATHETFSPYLKLGHDDGQKLIQSDGLPAAGWIGRIYRIGSKLVADFVDIPDQIFQLIQNKAYKKVSAEILFGVEILDKKFPKMLGAVSLLGANTPGVMNLTDILARYGINANKIKSFASNENAVTIKSYEMDIDEIQEDGMSKELVEAQGQIKTLEGQLATSQADVAKFTKNDNERQKQIDDLTKSVDAIKKDYKAKVDEVQKIEIEKEVDKLESEKLIPKSARAEAFALLGPEKKVYSFGKEGDEKEITRFEVLKNFAKKVFQSSGVNLDESSQDGEKANPKTGNIDKIDEEIKKYAAENKVSYAAAYRVIAPKHAVELDKIPTTKVNDSED